MSTVESKKMTLTPVKDMSYKEAVALAEKIAFIEAGVSKMKEHLKLYVKTNGPVEFGDSVWDSYPSQSWKWTVEAKRICRNGRNRRKESLGILRVFQYRFEKDWME